MVDSVSYLPTELNGAALQMGQYYKLSYIKAQFSLQPRCSLFPEIFLPNSK